MNRIILNFIKDKLNITLVYFINTFLIILFFYLYIDKSIPILYPIVLSTSIYILFFNFEFYRYYKFNWSIMKAAVNENVDILANTKEHEEIKKAINTISNRYMNGINKLKEESKINNRFFSQWVHNMKTPVSVIEIIIEKLKQDIESNKINEDIKKETLFKLIQELEEENNKILNGLDGVLNMIRLENFSRDYMPETVNLYGSLKKAINDRKSQFVYNNIFPKVICECKQEKVLSDRKWNEFMLGQIISNAIKYSRAFSEDKSECKFVCFNIKRCDKYTIITIKDEGIGIPNYDINRVFEAFFTGENGRRYKNSTGIGLYICKVICEKLAHDITIESEFGKGTEVKIKYLSKL
ncbi:sensor histidine kinase [Clostridium lundense]|uniref:sensor histidine kinase n=1 Tax=Clostridium lundense TaxID=319475 RepID=UPI000556D15E|nr:sensor histidine kinase [Clostridium lundense]